MEMITASRIALTNATVNPQANDYEIVINKTTAGATPVTLPASPAYGLVYIYKDGKGDAAINNITITPASGTIDGAASYVISSNYGAVELFYNGNEWSSRATNNLGNVTSVAGRSGNIILSMTDLAALPMPKWRTALARVRAGTGNARWIMAGDSTTRGHGALGNPNVSNFKYSPAAYLSGMMNTSNLNINAHFNSFYGGGGPNGASTTDSRIVVTGAFSTENGGNSLGGSLFRADTTGQISFTPTVNVDTFEIYYYQGASLGSFSCNINGGTASTVSTSGSSAMLVKTITGTLGNNTVNINWASGGSVFIAGIRAYDSSRKWLSIDSCGNEGVTSAGWIAAGNAYDPITAAVNLAPDLITFCLGINDWDNAVSLATYTSNMQSLITAAKVTSDVALITPTPSNPGTNGTTPATTVQQTYVYALIGLAQSNNIPIIDIYSRWGSYALMNGLGNYFDGLHPNSAGYGDQAQGIYNVLKPQ